MKKNFGGNLYALVDFICRRTFWSGLGCQFEIHRRFYKTFAEHHNCFRNDLQFCLVVTRNEKIAAFGFLRNLDGNRNCRHGIGRNFLFSRNFFNFACNLFGDDSRRNYRLEIVELKIFYKFQNPLQKIGEDFF